MQWPEQAILRYVLFTFVFQKSCWLIVEAICGVFFLDNSIISSSHRGCSIKESLAQAFSCELCEISKNTFLTEHLRATASVLFSFQTFTNIHLNMPLKKVVEMFEDYSCGGVQFFHSQTLFLIFFWNFENYF